MKQHRSITKTLIGLRIALATGAAATLALAGTRVTGLCTGCVSLTHFLGRFCAALRLVLRKVRAACGPWVCGYVAYLHIDTKKARRGDSARGKILHTGGNSLGRPRRRLRAHV